MTGLRLSEQAEADLLGAVDLISAESRAAALRLVDGFEAAVIRLSQFPSLGHRHALVPEAYRVVVVMGWLLV